MPELPEVEGFRTIVERHTLGRTIHRAVFRDDWMLKDTTPRTAARRLAGRTVSGVERRGKILLVFTRAHPGEHGPPVLALHFGMTGHPVAASNGAPVHRWDRLRIVLDHGEELRIRNSRRLGFLRVLLRADLPGLLWGLGPDPLEAPAAYLREAFAHRRASVKAVLLDQAALAGVGNIYADEALHAAGIRPDRPASSLAPAEVDRLHRQLRRILKRAVRAHVAGRDASFPLFALRGLAARNLALTGVPGLGCPSCGRELEAARLGGRTSYFCASCQT